MLSLEQSIAVDVMLEGRKVAEFDWIFVPRVGEFLMLPPLGGRVVMVDVVVWSTAGVGSRQWAQLLCREASLSRITDAGRSRVPRKAGKAL